MNLAVRLMEGLDVVQLLYIGGFGKSQYHQLMLIVARLFTGDHYRLLIAFGVIMTLTACGCCIYCSLKNHANVRYSNMFL